MPVKKQPIKLAGVFATLTAAFVLIATIDGANARNQARANLNQSQSTGQSTFAKNDHDHRHHRHGLRFSQLPGPTGLLRLQL